MGDKLDTFFNPKSIAIIGASNTQGKIGNILMNKLKGFKGKIIPINPHEKKVLNITSYKSLLDYSKDIDLAVIATPKKTIPELLKQIAKKEIKNLIIITSGFSETGDKKSEKNLIKFAEEHNVNILGPNCLGMINTENNLDLTFSKKTPKKGDTVFISQSGALGSFVMDLDIPLRAFISVGNMANLNFNDFIEYFNKDKETKKIILYIERIKDGKEFIKIAKESKKQIIAIKSGKTKLGQKSTLSHTGSLSTDLEIYKGAFKQANVDYSESLSEAFGLEKENIIHSLKGKNVAVITNAGGAGALLTDELIENNFKVFGPKDILGTATANDYSRTLHRLKGDYDNIIVIFTPQTMSEPIKTAQSLVKSRWKHKIIAVFLGQDSIKEATEILKGHSIPTYTQAI